MRLLLALPILFAACSTPKEPPAAAPPSSSTTPAAPTASRPDASFAGRYRGVEGMYLVVAPPDAAGRTKLEMQYDLDHKGTFDGTTTSEGISFVRDGKTEVLRPSDGDKTGLKYLAGKKDCLTVREGEGYCRD
jgi:hypothetical protein